VKMMVEMVQQMLSGMGGGGGGGGGMGGLPPGTHVIHLTQEQAASVARLQELGFSRQAVLKHYVHVIIMKKWQLTICLQMEEVIMMVEMMMTILLVINPD